MTTFSERYGPVAVVTGASSGIGRAFAELLAAKGLNLILVARREDRLNTLVESLTEKHGVEVETLALDLASPSAINRIAQATEGKDIGLLVSNAGFGLKGPHEDNDPEMMTDMLQVNCQAPLQLSHRLIPHLKSRGRGGIIITSSVEGLMGVPNSAAYAASKAFTNSLGESLWGELSPLGIDVLALCPGSTDTEAHEKQGIDRSTLEGMMSSEDVAGLALDRLSDGPIYIAGEQNRAMFDVLLEMPRRDALLAMGENILKALK